MTLQPNQKIKHPHAPADRETVAYVSTKHCIHRRSKTEHIARRTRCKTNIDELRRVPRVDVPKVNVHRAVHRSFVSRKQAFGFARVIEHFIQRVSTLFAAEHSKKNAAAEDRIYKSGGVACQHPAIAVQTRASIGEIRFDVDLRGALRVYHSFRNGWLFRQRLLEKIVSTEPG